MLEPANEVRIQGGSLANEHGTSRVLFESAIARVDTARLVAQLGALQAITDPALSKLGIATLTHEVLKRLCEGLSVEGASLHLLAEGADELSLAATEGARRTDGTSERVPLRGGVVGCVAATGKPIVVEDLIDDESLPLVASQHVASVAAVPLRLQGRLTGVLSVATAMSRRFDDSDVTLLSTAADRLALAIDRARVGDAEQRARSCAEDALRVRDDFLSMASHELKTPMTSLVLLVEILLRSAVTAAAEPNLEHSLRSIDRQVMRLAELTETLLDVARMNPSGAGLTLDAVDLGAVARAAVARATAATSHVGPAVSLRVVSPVVGRWDGRRCDQMLTHLLATASGHGGDGRIEIDVMADTENARIDVRDGGITTGDVLDSHISLWIVRRIVEAMGGRVSVGSAPGRGSALAVELPLRRPLEKS